MHIEMNKFWLTFFSINFDRLRVLVTREWRFSVRVVVTSLSAEWRLRHVILFVFCLVVDYGYFWYVVYLNRLWQLSVHTIVSIYLFNCHCIFWFVCVVSMVCLCVSLHYWAVFVCNVVIKVFFTPTVSISSTFAYINSLTFVACYVIDYTVFSAVCKLKKIISFHFTCKLFQ